MKKTVFILLILGLISISGEPALAVTEKTIGGSVSAKITPAIPAPFNQITVSLESYDVDLNRSQLTWIINSQREDSGLGLKTLTRTLGGDGSRSVWQIIIEAPAGRRLEKTITFRPASVDLLWQAATYTPFWYQGKALPTSESEIKVVAIPYILKSGGTPYRPEELSFTWFKDGKILSQSSGGGKNSVTFTGEKILGQNRIKVRVTSLDGLIAAEKEILIRMREPQVLMYFNNPLTGPATNRVLESSVAAPGPLFTILAEPFYFSLADLAADQVSFNWLVNNQPVVSKSGNARSVNFRAGDGSGQGTIKLEVNNQRSIFQTSRYEGVVNFRGQSDNFNRL